MVIPSQAPPPGKPLLKIIWVGLPQFQVGSVPWSTLGQPRRQKACFDRYWRRHAPVENFPGMPAVLLKVSFTVTGPVAAAPVLHTFRQ